MNALYIYISCLYECMLFIKFLFPGSITLFLAGVSSCFGRHISSPSLHLCWMLGASSFCWCSVPKKNLGPIALLLMPTYRSYPYSYFLIFRHLPRFWDQIPFIFSSFHPTSRHPPWQHHDRPIGSTSSGQLSNCRSTKRSWAVWSDHQVICLIQIIQRARGIMMIMFTTGLYNWRINGLGCEIPITLWNPRCMANRTSTWHDIRRSRSQGSNPISSILRATERKR